MAEIRAQERRQLTAMLCDLVAWTALAQRLDPEELAELIQGYRRRCAATVAAHGGTIAQYVGDGVLAYFGYPRAHEDDAERAIRAALAIAVAEQGANGDSNVHIGIATGTVVIVGAGSDEAAHGAAPGAEAGVSAIGSALNLAARLQALAEPGMVVLSAETRRLAGGLFEFRDLGQHALKGFDDPVRAFQVVGERDVRSRFHALRASNLTPFVGRGDALQCIEAAWQQVRGGAGRAVLISGDAGVGKSRLAEVVDARVVGRDCLRLWYYCAPNLQGSPFAPVIRYLRFAARLSEQDDQATRQRKLADFLPEQLRRCDDAMPLLGALLGVAVDGTQALAGMSPQRHRQRLLELLVALLRCFAERAPVLLVVEDLHWIDPSSDELIGLIVDALPTLPLLLLLTARPEFQSLWDERAQLLHLPLAPLPRSETLTMIGLLCGERALPAQTVEQIAERTDGLPLFVEDLTRDLLEHGTATPPGGAAIPATLSDSLMSRLDRLGSAKAVAQLGAVIGREFSYELLARVAGRDDEALRDELLRLVGAGLLLRRRPGVVPVYAFKHALVRDAAYASLLHKEAVALHARIARVLAEDFPDAAEAEPAVLANHHAAAHEVPQAVRYLIQAAKQSARRSGFVEAIAQLQRALELLAAQPASPGRTQAQLRVWLALGGVHAEHSGFASQACADAYERALTLARELGDPPEIFAVLSGLGAVEITRAAFERCRSLADETLQRAQRQHAQSPFVMGHLLLGGTLFLRGELEPALSHLDDALRIYGQQQRTGRLSHQVMYVQDQKSTGLCYQALALTLGGWPARGLHAALDGLAHSEALGGGHTINFSLCYLAAVLHIQRDHAGARQRALQSLQAAREHGFATWVGPSAAIAGASSVHLGDVDAGLEQITYGIRDYMQTQALTYQPFWLSLRAEALAAAARTKEAIAELDAAIALAEAHGERFYLAELLRFKGELLLREGLRNEAQAWIERAIALARNQGARLLELRSAMTLAMLLDGERRAAVVEALVAPLLHGFDEADRSLDLSDARRLVAACDLQPRARL